MSPRVSDILVSKESPILAPLWLDESGPSTSFNPNHLWSLLTRFLDPLGRLVCAASLLTTRGTLLTNLTQPSISPCSFLSSLLLHHLPLRICSSPIFIAVWFLVRVQFLTFDDRTSSHPFSSISTPYSLIPLPLPLPSATPVEVLALRHQPKLQLFRVTSASSVDLDHLQPTESPVCFLCATTLLRFQPVRLLLFVRYTCLSFTIPRASTTLKKVTHPSTGHYARSPLLNRPHNPHPSLTATRACGDWRSIPNLHRHDISGPDRS